MAAMFAALKIASQSTPSSRSAPAAALDSAAIGPSERRGSEEC
jgi:hypothetical protein